MEDNKISIAPMNEIEARECVRQINSTAAEMGRLLLDLKAREGWRALGYSTWTECLENEFEYSRKYLYEIMRAAPVIESLSALGYKVNSKQANALAAFPVPLHSAIVMTTEARYGGLTESRIQRTGETFLQAARTGSVNHGDGSETSAFDAALSLEDEEAKKRQWEYRNVGRTIISFKDVSELATRLREALDDQVLVELVSLLAGHQTLVAIE